MIIAGATASRPKDGSYRKAAEPPAPGEAAKDNGWPARNLAPAIRDQSRAPGTGPPLRVLRWLRR
jgi:hypothetical protein